ncbi:hypothetical protein TWF694_008303 [Orbilia ellipsospora]|uniref:Ankyrin repeat protein n=1 Tax=Orbilia ellipsospora TaxID=2528407 RepID=A0AAV9XGB1_9PEZI
MEEYALNLYSDQLPLLTDNTELLQLLLCSGFSAASSSMLFRAILFNKIDLAQILLNYHNLRFDREKYSEESGNVWEILEIPTFYEIAVGTAIDMSFSKFRLCNGCRKREGEWVCGEVCQLDELLMYAVSVNLDFTNYILRVFEWKYSSVPIRRDVLVSAVDAIPITNPSWLPEYLYRGTRMNPVSVLEELVNLGVDLSKTMVWKEKVWASENRVLQAIISCSLNAGIDIDQKLGITLDISGINFKYNVKIQVDESMRLIDIAFFRYDPTVFIFLLQHGADTAHFAPNMLSGNGFTILPEFINAVHDRNLATVEMTWRDRIHIIELSISDRIMTALDAEDTEDADHIVSRCTDASMCVDTFLEVSRWIFWPDGNCYMQNKKVMQMLRTLLQSIPNPFDDEDISNSYIISDIQGDRFDLTVLLAIDSSNVEILELLLDFRARTQSAFENKRLQIFSGISNPLMFWAGTHDVNCVKILIKLGFHINEFTISDDYYYTALAGAIYSGKMEIIFFLISKGADLYAPCGKSSSAVAEAIRLGRIDTVAFILEVEPGCYAIVLEAVMNSKYQNIKEFVQKWKPGLKGSVLDAIIGDDDETMAELCFDH